ncbi:YrzI family small protein [Fictibacillus macauensis]|nr:YrzI family small protein [Fictibacillus macauensis]
MTLNLFFATITISMKKKTAAPKVYGHEQVVRTRFESAYEKAYRNVRP